MVMVRSKEGVPCNLWGMKEPDYVMRMMATGGPMSVIKTCKETVRKWMEDGVEVVRRFKYTCPFDWHFIDIVMPSTIITISAMGFPRLRTLGSLRDGRFGCSHSSWRSRR